MKNKKFFVLLMVFSLVLTLLAGCAKSGSDSQGQTDSPKEPTENTDAEAPAETEKPKWQTEKITLKFASWEDEKVEAAMMQAFMDLYPNITVVKDETINWPFEESLSVAAAAGNMPDVFWLKDVPLGIQNDWLLDISPHWDTDPEAQTVYTNLADTMVYGNKRYASPTFQFVMGVFVNKTLFEKYNVPLPSYDWTIDEMVDLAKQLSKPNDHVYGIGGAWGDLMFNEFFPMQNDASIGYNTYDGEQYHFSKQEWIDAYNLKLELRRLKVEENMTGEEKMKVFGDEGAWPTQRGHVAMAIDGSWNLGWMPEDMKKSGAGEIDFYPFPGGKAGQRMPVILDYIGVSSTTEHPEAAYELSKFMTWGKEGWLKRIDVMKELGVPFDKYPLSDQPEIFSKLEPETALPGEKAIFERLHNAVTNPPIPGYNDFAAWDAEQQLTEKINSGEYKVADKAKELEDKANEFIAKAREELNSK